MLFFVDLEMMLLEIWMLIPNRRGNINWTSKKDFIDELVEKK